MMTLDGRFTLAGKRAAWVEWRGMKYLPLLAACLCLSSCKSTVVRKVTAVDPRDKSIMVPEGGGPFTGGLKDALREHGWRVVIGDPGTERATNKDLAKIARYSMTVDSVYIINSHVRSVDVSVIDNKTRDEVVTLHGNGVAAPSITKVINALEGR